MVVFASYKDSLKSGICDQLTCAVSADSSFLIQNYVVTSSRSTEKIKSIHEMMFINNVICSFTHQMDSTVEYIISQMYWIFLAVSFFSLSPFGRKILKISTFKINFIYMGKLERYHACPGKGTSLEKD